MLLIATTDTFIITILIPIIVEYNFHSYNIIIIIINLINFITNQFNIAHYYCLHIFTIIVIAIIINTYRLQLLKT